MIPQTKCALAAGLLFLALANGCAPVQPVALPFYATTTPPIPPQDARLRYVYCVTAPKGYVIQQDKWDPYLVPCPVRAVPTATRSDSAPDGPDNDDPGRTTPPPSPPPEQPKPSHEGVKAGEAQAEVTRNDDGTTTETSTTSGSSATVTY